MVTLSINITEAEKKAVYPAIPLTLKMKEGMRRHVDSVMHQEMKDVLVRFLHHIPSYKDEKGDTRSKCEITSFSVNMMPKSHNSMNAKDRQNLDNCIRPRAERLAVFKNLDKLVFICFFLSKKRFSDADVDNLAKPIMDGLKHYFGDDNRVTVLITEKRMLSEQYPKDDLDFLENSLVVITDAMVRDDIIRI